MIYFVVKIVWSAFNWYFYKGDEMAIDLNDFELIEINASDTGEGIEAEYAYVNKKQGSF